MFGGNPLPFGSGWRLGLSVTGGSRGGLTTGVARADGSPQPAALLPGHSLTASCSARGSDFCSGKQGFAVAYVAATRSATVVVDTRLASSPPAAPCTPGAC